MIRQILNTRLVERYEAALAVAKFIVVCESEGTPLTHNHYFNDNLEKLRRIELEKGMRKNAVSVQVNGKYQQVAVLDAKTAIAPKDNVERSVADLHGILRAYYKVARKRFVDVFCMQAIDYHVSNWVVLFRDEPTFMLMRQ